MSQLQRSKLLKIPFKEIRKATNNFRYRIGNGGYGVVYKGVLIVFGKRTPVAIKRLDKQHGQGAKEFLTEIELLSRQKHPNLIYLVGYCDDGEENIIVYEYAKHGSLDRYLLRGNTAQTHTTRTLTWLKRLKICVDAARGVDYLHNHVGKHQTIIHRDIKSSNILIDKNCVAKVSDFGLSKLSFAGVDRSYVVSYACGTYGYCEPEYAITSIVTKESDVYSFGIVLFEVLCGRLCTNIIDNDGFKLSPFLAKEYYIKSTVDEIVDPSLKEEVVQKISFKEEMNLSLMKGFAAIACECLRDKREQRPTMNLVMKKLQQLLNRQITLEKVRGIFRRFDRNKDGGLNKKELEAFLVATNSGLCSQDEIRRGVDEVFLSYKDFIHSKGGLTCDGLLRLYDDEGHLDSEYDVLGLRLEINNNKEPPFSIWDRYEKVRRIFQKFDLNNDGGLSREELAALLVATNPDIRYGDEEIRSSLDALFNQYKEYINGEKGLTFNGLLLSYDQRHLDLDLAEKALKFELISPNIDDQVCVTKIDYQVPNTKADYNQVRESDDQIAMGRRKRNLVGVHWWLIAFLAAWVLLYNLLDLYYLLHFNDLLWDMVLGYLNPDVHYIRIPLSEVISHFIDLLWD